MADLAGVQLTGKGNLPTPPPDVTERELIQAARRLGISEQWFRRRSWKAIREKNIQREAEVAQLKKMLGTLPDIFGEEVLLRLRAAPETRHVPVVVISADATAGQVERLRTLGAHAYLTKPLDVKRLLELVDEVMAGAEAVPPPA